MRTSLERKSLVLYDSNCGICTKFRSAVEFLDAKEKMRFVPLSRASSVGVEMREEELYSSFHFVNSEGKISSGAKAIPNLVEKLPAGSVFSGTILQTTLSHRIIHFLYRTISRLHNTCPLEGAP